MPKFRKPGYTQIPNEIFDQLMPQLSGAQFKILCLIARKTLGFHRECHAMGLDALSSGSGLSRQGVLDATEALCKEGWIEKEKQSEHGKSAASLYSLAIEDDPPLGVKLVDPSTEVGVNSVDIKSVDPPIRSSLKETTSVKETTIPPVVPQESQPPTPEDSGATLDDEDSGAEPRKPFKRQWSRKKEPKPMSYTETALKRMRGTDVTGAPPRPEIPVPTTSAQNPPVILPVPGVIVAEWNKLVPSCPATWSDSQDTPLLRKAMADVQFLDSYRDIFAKAELINQNSDRGPWLTLQSLLSNSKNGQPHWYRIYSGQYAGMMKPQAKRGGTPDYVEKLIAEREARRAKKRTEGTDAGN